MIICRWPTTSPCCAWRAASLGKLLIVAERDEQQGSHMTKTISILATALLLTAAGCNQAEAPVANGAVPDATATAAAATSIDGTWKVDLASAKFEEEPSVYLLKDGSYSCSTCVPPLTVAADGAFHAVADRPYFDSMSVKTVDDKTVNLVRKKGDRIVNETTLVVSPDGKTLAFNFKNTSSPDAPPVTGKGVETRVAAAPPGSHAISGSWKTARYDNISDEGLTFSYRLEGDMLNMTSVGESYVAKLDGTDAPIKGDTAGTVVSVERLAPNSFRETFKRDGKPVSVTTMTLTEDGKMTVVSDNKMQKSTTRYTAARI